MPYAALHFGAYEHYREILVKAAASMSKSSVSNYTVPPALDLVAGSAAGATAVLVNIRPHASVYRTLNCSCTVVIAIIGHRNSEVSVHNLVLHGPR